MAKAYGEELRSLHAAGCRYVQMDDTNLAYLCDDKMREAARSRGDDPDELPHRYATFINRVVRKKPAGMVLAVHLCRGNFKSTWAAQGSYEPVAEALLTEMNVDAYFLEYDDARSGDFKPLRFLPKGKTVVLGLVTTKLGELENKDDLKRRIDEAAQYAPLEQLALEPAVRLFQHRARQRHRGGSAARQAAAGGRNRRRGVEGLRRRASRFPHPRAAVPWPTIASPRRGMRRIPSTSPFAGDKPMSSPDPPRPGPVCRPGRAARAAQDVTLKFHHIWNPQRWPR